MSSLQQSSPADIDSTEKLTDKERELVSRILSDPFSYPQSFKTWLVSFLESSDLSLTPQAIIGLVDLIKRTPHTTALMEIFGKKRYGVQHQPGFIIPYAGANAPPGTLHCNGGAVSRQGYPELFAAIGTRWGAGNGSTTFNLPDLRGVRPPGNTQIIWLISY